LVEHSRILLAATFLAAMSVQTWANPAPVPHPPDLAFRPIPVPGSDNPVPVLEPSLPSLEWQSPPITPPDPDQPHSRWSWGDVSRFADRLADWMGSAVRDWMTAELLPREEAGSPVGPADRQFALYENKQVAKFIRVYLETHREAFMRGLARAGQYIPMIQEMFRAKGLPPDLAYLAIVESNLNPLALSPKRAAGLWQFMPDTAQHYGLRVEPWYDERLDPVLSTQAAARMLSYLHDRYGNWELALAAYNAGEGRVNRALRHSRSSGDEEDFWNLSLPLQTRRYVPSFIAVALIYNDLEGHGFAPLEPQSMLQSEDLHDAFLTSLGEVARRTGMEQALLEELNPAWRQGFVPLVHEGKVLLRLPPGGAQRIRAALAKGGPFTPPRMMSHVVARGETLGLIARRYGVDMDLLLAANRIGNRHLLRRGQKLSIPVPVAAEKAAGRRSET